MKKNLPRFLAWVSLIFGLTGGPAGTRLGHPIPPVVLRWSLTAAAALMIISFFWFPRRGQAAKPERATRAPEKPPRRVTRRVVRRAKRKEPVDALPKTPAKAPAKARPKATAADREQAPTLTGRRARKQAKAPGRQAKH